MYGDEMDFLSIIFQWFSENFEWVFSGIGLFIFGLISKKFRTIISSMILLIRENFRIISLGIGLGIALTIFSQQFLSPNNLELALKKCEPMEGEYKLMGKGQYLFMDYKLKDENEDIFDFRAIGTKAYYKTEKCKSDNKENVVSLRGIDESGHDVEVKINNEFIKVTHVTGVLDSTIRINSKGVPYVRELTRNEKENFPEDEIKKKKYTEKIPNYDNHKEKIEKTIKKYKELRSTRPSHVTDEKCYPTIGRKDKNYFIVSFCPGDKNSIFPTYYRAMDKCASNAKDCKSNYKQ